MKQTSKITVRTAIVLVLRYKKMLLGLAVVAMLVPVLLVVLAYAVIEPNSKYILPIGTARHMHVGLVLGAGVTPSGQPYRELKARLDLAAQALADGRVDKLLLSGDNRFKNYNEPGAMLDYLKNVKHIPVSKLQPDYAGRSTYESCERARKVFGLRQTIIVSSESHLPRAIYLCRHFGIESYGIATPVEANNSFRREALARVKALLNVYIYGERTII